MQKLKKTKRKKKTVCTHRHTASTIIIHHSVGKYDVTAWNWKSANENIESLSLASSLSKNNLREKTAVDRLDPEPSKNVPVRRNKPIAIELSQNTRKNFCGFCYLIIQCYLQYL